jgi:hypothetical protein
MQPAPRRLSDGLDKIMQTGEQEAICAECGHRKGDHASACAVRISSAGGRDVYCPCAMFRGEELQRERPVLAGQSGIRRW